MLATANTDCKEVCASQKIELINDPLERVSNKLYSMIMTLLTERSDDLIVGFRDWNDTK